MPKPLHDPLSKQVDQGSRMNFPTTHPLCLTDRGGALPTG